MMGLRNMIILQEVSCDMLNFYKLLNKYTLYVIIKTNNVPLIKCRMCGERYNIKRSFY